MCRRDSDYTVTVKYAGDDKYTAVEIAKGVNVAKAQPVLGVVTVSYTHLDVYKRQVL